MMQVIFDGRKAELQPEVDRRDHHVPQINHTLYMGGLLRNGPCCLGPHVLAYPEYPDAEFLAAQLKHQIFARPVIFRVGPFSCQP